jgi:hypothetical protein
VAGAGVLVAAGATAALLVLARGPSGYAAVTRIQGVTLAAGQRFAHPPVLIETDGKVTPAEVMAAYRATLARLRAFAPEVKARLDVVDEIVAIPGPALCAPSAYPVAVPPDDCRRVLATHAIGAHGSHNLLIRDDRAGLPLAMDAGVAGAVCEFQPTDDPARLAKICDMTRRFAAAGR